MNARAFTLAETIVVIAITSLVVMALSSLLVYFYQTHAYLFVEATAVQEARRSLDDAALYLREASYGANGSYPITSAATSSVSFYIKDPNTLTISQMTYTIRQGTLYRVVTDSGVTATTTLATSINDATTTPTFQYYDTSGAELTPPITPLTKIASLHITLRMSVGIHAPRLFTLSSAATLRNNVNRP